MLIGSRSGRSRCEPPLATFCGAGVPAVADWRPAVVWILRGLRSAAVDDRDVILRSLLEERTVDIVTTGRGSSAARTTEIWTTVVDGQTYSCGTPNASRAGVEHQPRDWLANLVATPEFVVRLKTSVQVDLPARAVRVDDPAERRRVLTAPDTEYYRNAVSLEAAIAHMVRVQFTALPPGGIPRSAPGGPRPEPFGRIPSQAHNPKVVGSNAPPAPPATIVMSQDIMEVLGHPSIDVLNLLYDLASSGHLADGAALSLAEGSAEHGVLRSLSRAPPPR